MRRNIIIADDFYDNPNEVRQFALNSSYPTPGNKTYPGKNSKEKYYTEETHTKLLQLIGREVIPAEGSACGFFRSSFKNDSFEQDIHIDPGWDWGGVLYLNLPNQCITDAGTSFYIHKTLKTEKAPLTYEEGYVHGYTNYEEIRQSIICGDGLDHSKWDQYAYVPIKYNRVVLFRPWLWHSHSKNFGDCLQNGRLVQLFFLSNK